jgi:hypothetical protein
LISKRPRTDDSRRPVFDVDRRLAVTDGPNRGSGVSSLTYTRDGANLPTDENSVTYGPYDPLNRLPTSSQDAHQYDAADRIRSSGTSNVQTLSYDNAD